MKKQFIISLTIMTAAILNLHGKGLEVGSPAPDDLVAQNQNAEMVDLGSAFSQGLTLVYFYPKADTPGCTAQSCSLRDDYDSLVDKGIQIFGVSYDSPKSQLKFKEKYELPFDLIADEDKIVSKAFGRGFFSRQAYLIKDGVIVWRDLKASTRGQSSDVTEAMAELGI